MRICMLVTSELDRDPRVQKEARSAVECGHEVTVVCRSYSGPPLPYRVVPLSIGRPMSRWAKYAERLYTNLALVHIASRSAPDIVHANDLDTLPAAYVVSRLRGAKLVYDAHELWASAGRDIGHSAQRVALSVERYLSKRADATVAVSRLRAGRMAELLGIPTPVVVMNTPRYIPFDSLPLGTWLQAFDGRRVVLHQGRYVAGRGLPEAVLAARYLPDDVVLVFRGYGPIEPELRALVPKHSLEGKVVFVPPVAMDDLVASALGSDLGLVLYTPVNENNLYAAPNKMFEYIMAGVPCVSSDIPYAREVLLENDLGIVFRPGDSEDMARAIVELLDDHERLTAMRERCIEAAPRFSWDVEVKKLLGEYDRITAPTV